jgi:hypothetical protein
MATAVMRFGTTASLAVALIATTWPPAQGPTRVERDKAVAQYCAPTDSWDMPRLFCGRAED